MSSVVRAVVHGGSSSSLPPLRSRAKTIPLRLDDDERTLLRVLECALEVSDYTERVDTIRLSGKVGRIVQQLGDVLAVLAGMFVVAEGRRGQELVQDRTVGEMPELFGAIFEAGRRYKVMNPDKMRGSHGKLMCMLQDAQISEIRTAIGFDMVRAIRTVEDELAQLDADALLDDDDLAVATAPVVAGGSHAAKAEATQRLMARHGGDDAAARARIERVVISIADDAVLTEAHVRPVEQMLAPRFLRREEPFGHDAAEDARGEHQQPAESEEPEPRQGRRQQGEQHVEHGAPGGQLLFEQWCGLQQKPRIFCAH